MTAVVLHLIHAEKVFAVFTVQLLSWPDLPPVSFIKVSAEKTGNKTAFSSARAWIKR